MDINVDANSLQYIFEREPTIDRRAFPDTFSIDRYWTGGYPQYLSYLSVSNGGLSMIPFLLIGGLSPIPFRLRWHRQRSSRPMQTDKIDSWNITSYP